MMDTTPLMEAAFKGYAPILELLLKHGAKIDIQGRPFDRYVAY